MAKMTTQTPTENQNIDVQALMAQMEALQKQNADILEKLATSSENTFEKAKKKYE
jgi:4-hydroxy-3-methylbut-2-en-1-yl diphosphate synthase IspG/GcpE